MRHLSGTAQRSARGSHGDPGPGTSARGRGARTWGRRPGIILRNSARVLDSSLLEDSGSHVSTHPCCRTRELRPGQGRSFPKPGVAKEWKIPEKAEWSPRVRAWCFPTLQGLSWGWAPHPLARGGWRGGSGGDVCQLPLGVVEQSSFRSDAAVTAERRGVTGGHSGPTRSARPHGSPGELMPRRAQRRDPAGAAPGAAVTAPRPRDTLASV